MPVIVNERTQYVDEGGKPLVNGKVFIGVVTQDPVINPEPIFADRALTIPLPNPQLLNSRGQSVNKIYVTGRYSFKLENSSGSQIEQDLDRGEIVGAGGIITVLSSIAGINDLTANSNPPIVSYIDKAQFSLTLVQTPTGAMTLNIEGLGAVSIKNAGTEIQPGQLRANEVITLAFNSIGPVFELTSGVALGPLAQILNTNGFSINESQGLPVASSAQPNIWAQDGNTIHITGTDQIDDFTDAPRIGAKVSLIFDGVLTLTNGSGITLPGAADILTRAGDRFEVYADAVNAFSGIYIKNVSPSPFATQLLHIIDLKGNTISGGTFTAGANQTRVLNNIVTNEIQGASLLNNQITLPIGVYYADASATAFRVRAHLSSIINVSGSTVNVIGSREFGDAAFGGNSRSVVQGRFSTGAITVIELRHICQTTKVNDGFGIGDFSLGTSNIFSIIKIWKIG
jgi:hypothetical protein